MPCLRCKHTARRSSSRERKRSTCGPGASDISVAPYTTDGDLAIDPSLLGDDPELEPTMEDAGFRLKTQPGGPVEPGMWIVEVDIEGKPEVILVDLIVPESAASNSGRRGARLGPHAKRAARQIPGLESVLIDHSPIVVRRSIPRTVGRSKWKRPALQHSWSPKRTSCTTESTKVNHTRLGDKLSSGCALDQYAMVMPDRPVDGGAGSRGSRAQHSARPGRRGRPGRARGATAIEPGPAGVVEDGAGPRP